MHEFPKISGTIRPPAVSKLMPTVVAASAPRYAYRLTSSLVAVSETHESSSALFRFGRSDSCSSSNRHAGGATSWPAFLNGRRRPDPALEFVSAPACQLSYPLCRAGIHPLDRGGNPRIRLFQEPGIVAVLCGLRPGVCSCRPRCSMVLGCHFIYRTAPGGASAIEQWQRSGASLAKSRSRFGRGNLGHG